MFRVVTIWFLTTLSWNNVGVLAHASEGGRAKPFYESRVNPAQVERQDRYWRQAQRESEESNEIHTNLASAEALPRLVRGNPRLKELALTFDDGPHPGKTEALLDLLRKEDVKATFFVIGKMVEKYPNLLKRIYGEGHQIANHTFSHVTLTKIPDEEVETEYRATMDLVRKITGKSMRYCRPPGGDYNRNVIKTATSLGMTTVLWTDDPGDYANPGDRILHNRTLARMSNGGIILLHDGVKETLKVLPKIIEDAKSRGFKFVTVDELARHLDLDEKKPAGLAHPRPAISSSVSG